MSRGNHKLLLALGTIPQAPPFHHHHHPRLFRHAHLARHHRSRHCARNHGIHVRCVYRLFTPTAVLYAFDWGGGVAILGEGEEMVGTGAVYGVCRGVNGDEHCAGCGGYSKLKMGKESESVFIDWRFALHEWNGILCIGQRELRFMMNFQCIVIHVLEIGFSPHLVNATIPDFLRVRDLCFAFFSFVFYRHSLGRPLSAIHRVQESKSPSFIGDNIA